MTRDLATVFAGLHDALDERVGQLIETYDATRRPVREDEAARLIPSVRGMAVLPSDPAAGPLLVGWTEHPGLVCAAGTWAGPWHFPSCGCDACDETLDSALEEFDVVVAGVTAGFREWVSAGWRVEIGYATSATSGWARYSWPQARRRGLPRGWRRRRWAPWPYRVTGRVGT